MNTLLLIISYLNYFEGATGSSVGNGVTLGAGVTLGIGGAVGSKSFTRLMGCVGSEIDLT
jgi:acetyltransferase-like isoleucine patch superfamily enzyme